MSELTKQQLAALTDVTKKNPEWALQQAFRFGLAALSDDDTQASVERAAEMLEYDAECLKEAHTIGGKWHGESEAKQDYDERKKVAKELRGMVVGAVEQAA